MEERDKLIGCCGLDCETCDARIATIHNDEELRKKTAALWSELNGVTIRPEEIHCLGCRMEGPKTPFCDSLCSIRRCVRLKGFKTCADCKERETCVNHSAVAKNNPSCLENLNRLKAKELLGYEPKAVAGGTHLFEPTKKR